MELLKLLTFSFLAVLCSAVGTADELRMLLGRSPGHTVPAQPLSVSRTKDCPQGFELQGKQCVSTEVLPFDFVCPAGTTVVNQECASFQKAERICPSGFQLSGDSCFQITKVPVQYECAEGETMGSLCRITAETEPYCPSGFQMTNGECARFSAQQPRCPQEHTLEGERCVRRESYAPTPICRPGFEFGSSSACEKTVYSEPRCPKDYMQLQGACMKEVDPVAAPCPTGFTGVGDGCRKTDEYPMEEYCPEDYELSQGGKYCSREIPVPATCPAGFTRGSKGTCEKPASRVPVCQPHEQLRTESQGPVCITLQEFPAEPQCPSDYTLIHGKCKRAVKSDPSPRCSAGTLSNGRCILESSTIPLLHCPAGYSLAKGQRCIREVPYDCPRTVTRNECHMPSFVAELERPRSLLAADYKNKLQSLHDYKNAVAPSAEKGGKMESKEPACQMVTESIPQTCTRTESAGVEYSCPDGTQPVGKSCSSIIEIEPEYFCRTGSMDGETGQCVDIAIAAPTKVCPEGTTMMGKSCRLTTSRPADEVCPHGAGISDSGRCVYVREEVSHPSQIEQRELLQRCPVGHRQGSHCITSTTLPRKLVCPSGSEEAGKSCLVSQPLILPPPVVHTMQPEYICHDGTSAHAGRMCISMESIPPDFVCSSGTLDGSRCRHISQLIVPPPRITQTAATPYCPEGQTMVQNECLLRHQEPAARVCPSGFISFEHHGYDCIKAHARIPVCPANTVKTENGCLRSHYVPPQVTEIKQCTKGTPGC